MALCSAREQETSFSLTLVLVRGHDFFSTWYAVALVTYKK